MSACACVSEQWKSVFQNCEETGRKQGWNVNESCHKKKIKKKDTSFEISKMDMVLINCQKLMNTLREDFVSLIFFGNI